MDYDSDMPLGLAERRRLRRRFERSLSRYAQEAFVQEEMANRLAEALRSFPSPQKVLEIGPGVGLLTSRLRSLWPDVFYLALDLVPGCGPYLRPFGVHFVVADAEELSWLRGEFDLIVSNATFQWFCQPEQSLNSYYQLLAPGGILAFTTFGPETMKELRFDRNFLRSLEDWQKMRCSFFPLVEKRWIKRLFFSTPLEALKHIRQTGALGYLPARWSLRELRIIFDAYLHLKEVRGFPLTYEPILLIWEKK